MTVLSNNDVQYLVNMANGKDQYGNPVSAGKVTWAENQLKKNQDALAAWQQSKTAGASASQTDTSSQATGTGVGTTSGNPTVVYVPTDTTYPASNIVPDVTKDAVTGYGFTAIVGLGVAMIVMSLISSFKSIRR